NARHAVLRYLSQSRDSTGETMTTQDPIVIDQRKTVDIVRIVMGVGGLIALVLGLLIVFNPIESGTVLMKIVAVALGCYLVIAGLVFLGSMVFSKTMGG